MNFVNDDSNQIEETHSITIENTHSITIEKETLESLKNFELSVSSKSLEDEFESS